MSFIGFFFFKQKTAYELRIRYWSSDVCSSDLWWRKTGRTLNMPVDGISGATRAPGEHVLRFAEGKAPLGKLPAGGYELVVEAAREVGGRELLRIPFQWPPKSAQSLKVQGQSELGAIGLTLKP